MQMMKRLCVLTLCLLSLQQHATDACTTMIVSKDGTTEGTPILAHTADCVECDTRMALVPGMSYPPGTKRPIYGVNAGYPRQRSKRAWIYTETHDRTPIVGHIPEVEYTYGSWEATYGLVNEVGLTIGESSCNSLISNAGIDMPDANGKKGPAMMCIGTLIQLALERCDAAVCAVKLMGEMAEKYGFYGEGADEGEALTVADTYGDAWVFQITQDFTTNASAIWAAQRVPPGHVAAVANSYTIREVPLEPTDDFLFSANIRSEAKAAKLWDGQEPLMFSKTFSQVTLPMYAAIRLNWIYSQFAPSAKIPLYDKPYEYPFSVPVDRAVTLQEFIKVFRTSYPGMKYDLTKGVLAGPWGNPFRIEGGVGMKSVPGEFARGISITRTVYMHVGYPHPENPGSIFLTDTPLTSVGAPFPSSVLKTARGMRLEETSELYSRTYQVGHKGKFTRDSAWWAFDLVANFMQISFQNMSGQIVYPTIDEWQEKMIDVYKSGGDIVEAQDSLIAAWWDMFETLIVRYNDGFYNYYPGHPENDPHGKLGYPTDYLTDIQFDKSYIYKHTVQDIVALDCKAPSDEDDKSLFDYGPWISMASSFVAGFFLCMLFNSWRMRSSKTRAINEPLLASSISGIQ